MKKILELRKWQIDALNAGRHDQKFICQAPGGSGKSLVELMLAQADIEDTGNKQLILVPQNHIHHSFFDEECIEFLLPWNDGPSRWIVGNNLCEGTDIVDRLREFLLADAEDLAQAAKLAAISTHRAMVAVWKTLSADERQAALRKMSLRIDEAHHISNAFHDADLELYNVKERQAIVADATRLGNIVRMALGHGGDNLKLHLATATFFRGDRKTILSKAFKTEFSHFELPWDEYFPHLGLELTFDFVTYHESPIEQVIEAVAAEPNEKHLIILPALTCRFRTPQTLDTLMAGLRKVYPTERVVLDLVTPETQDRNKSYLFAHPDDLSAVVACRLFDEGTDWPPCTRLHNTDAGERSLTLAVQRFFRPLRQHPTKRRVRIDNYIPAFAPSMTLGEQREVLSDRFNAVLAAVVTQGELMPVFVPIKSNAIVGKPKKKSKRLQDVFGNDYHPLLEDLLNGYEHLTDKNGNAVESMVTTILSHYTIPEGVEAHDAKAACLAEVLRYAASHIKSSDRHTLEIKAFDVAEIREHGFDAIWSKSSRGSALVWGTDNVSASMVRDLLTVVKPVPSLEDIAEAVKANYGRTGTRLLMSDCTRNGWLDEMGRSVQSVDHICRRYYGASLAKVVAATIGKPQDNLLEQAREVIGQYFLRNITLTRATKYIPEIGMSGETLDNRLRWYCKTTIRKELEFLFGKQRKPLSLPMVRAVIAQYRRRGTSVLRRHFFIPELGMSNSNLRLRLKKEFNCELADLVAEESGTSAQT